MVCQVLVFSLLRPTGNLIKGPGCYLSAIANKTSCRERLVWLRCPGICAPGPLFTLAVRGILHRQGEFPLSGEFVISV